MTSSESSSTSRRQAHIEQIETLLRPPPSLQAVAQQAAQTYLDTHFAAQRLSAGLIHLGTPAAVSTHAAPSYTYQSLPHLLVQRLASARPTLLVDDYQVVVLRVREVYAPGGPTLAELENLVNDCGALLLTSYAEHLQTWWGEPFTSNKTLWSYVSDHLLELLYDCAKPPGTNETEFAELFPKNLLRPLRPAPQWSLQGGPLRVQTLHLQGVGQVADQAQMLPLLVLSHGSKTLLFSPASGVHALDSVAAVGALLPAYTSPVLTGALSLSALVPNCATFTYAADWWQFALSEDLPLLQGQMFTAADKGTAPGALDDARPDRWGERVIRFLDKPARLSLLEYLLFAGDERFGALGVSAQVDAPFSAV